MLRSFPQRYARHDRLKFVTLMVYKRNLALYFPALNALQVQKVMSQFTPDSSCPNPVPAGLASKVREDEYDAVL